LILEINKLSANMYTPLTAADTIAQQFISLYIGDGRNLVRYLVRTGT
jgi:hypothetical protein